MGGLGSGRKSLRQEVNKLAIITKAWNITSKVLDTLDDKERIQIAKEIVLKDMQRLVPVVDARQINIHLGSSDVAQLKLVVKQLKELNAFSDDNAIDKAIVQGIDNVIDIDNGNGNTDGTEVGCGEGGGTTLPISETPTPLPISIIDNQNDTTPIPIVESTVINTSTAPPDGT